MFMSIERNNVDVDSIVVLQYEDILASFVEQLSSSHLPTRRKILTSTCMSGNIVETIPLMTSILLSILKEYKHVNEISNFQNCDESHSVSKWMALMENTSRALFHLALEDKKEVSKRILNTEDGMEIIFQMLSVLIVPDAYGMNIQSHVDQIVLYGSKVLTILAVVEKWDQRSMRGMLGDSLLRHLVKVLELHHHLSSESISSVIFAISNVALTSDATKTAICVQTSPLLKQLLHDNDGGTGECCNDGLIKVMTSIATMIANVSFQNVSASYALLQDDLVDILIRDTLDMMKREVELEREALELASGSITGKQTSITLLQARIMSMITNLANSVQNHALLYSIEHSIEIVLHALHYGEEPSLLTASSKACASLCYGFGHDSDRSSTHTAESTCTARRSIGIEGATSLIDIILRMGLHNETSVDKKESETAMVASWALATILFDDMTRQRLLNDNSEASLTNIDSGVGDHDVRALIQLYLQTECIDQVLVGGAMVIATLLPSREEKSNLLAEGRVSWIESEHGDHTRGSGGRRVLSRCMREHFNNDESVAPNWLIEAVQIVDCNDLSMLRGEEDKEVDEDASTSSSLSSSSEKKIHRAKRMKSIIETAGTSAFFSRDDLFENHVELAPRPKERHTKEETIEMNPFEI